MISAAIRALPPGSVAWLLANEVRLGLRGMSRKSEGKKPSNGNGARIAMVALGLIAAAVVIFGGVAMAFLAARFPLPVTPITAMIVDGAALVLFTLMLSQTINLSVQALFERGDLDLLLSSPLKPRVILTVRALAMIVVVAILYVGLVTPFVIAVSLLGRPEWLGLWVLLLTLAAIATACGIVLTMGLFALIGPRRTRAIAQILAALVGAMMFILSQAYNLTRSHDDRPSAIMNGVKQLSESGAFSNHSLLTWPVQAITGGLIPLAVIGLIGIVVVTVVIQLLAPRFATNAAEAVGDRTQPNRLKGADRDFAQGLTRSMVRKELRLLSRDPQLISQVLLRILYLFPLGFVLFRNADNINGIALGAAGLVVMSGQLAGSFAWVVLSAEDSPDLLQSAPINRAVADRAKLIAALTPTLFLSLLAIAGFAFLSPVAAMVVFVGCLCSASCSGLIQVWRQKPANRKAFNQRQRSSFLLGLAELIIQGGWGAATAMAVRGWIWAIIPALLAIGVTLLLRRAPDKRVTPV